MSFVPESSTEPTTSATPNLSPEKQKAIASVVETALYNSEVFQRTTSALQKLPERKRKAIENAIRVNCRQAIHLACQEMLQQYETLNSDVQEPTTAESSDGSDGSDNNDSDDPDLDFVPSPYLSQPPNASPAENQNGERWQQLSQLAGRVLGKKSSPPARETAKTSNPPDPPPTFEQQLQKIGKTLQKARKARSLSIEELHRQTFIPIYQIQALEAGQAENLPEEIYIRGFISRMSKILNIDGNNLLNALPESASAVIPSWHGKVSPRQINVNSPSMYLGYAAVFATALGSVVWLADNTEASSPSSEPDSENTLPSESEETSPSSGSASTNVAPPEWASGHPSIGSGQPGVWQQGR